MTTAAAAGATPLAARFGAGTASAAPGERAFGHLSATLPDGQTVPFALWVVNGRRPGPVLYVHSTQHGNEISGIEVVRRVAQSVDPRRLRGTLVAVPIANPLAFAWRRHHYRQEADEAYQAHPEKDMGQHWPGDPAGTVPERLTHALWDGAVRHASHVIDLHTWNRWQAAATTVDAWHAPSLDLALAFGLWVQGRPAPAPPEEYASRYLSRVAVDHGKAACTPNFTGQWDIYEPEVRRGVAGLRAVLRHLGMLPPARGAAAPLRRRGPAGRARRGRGHLPAPGPPGAARPGRRPAGGAGAPRRLRRRAGHRPGGRPRPSGGGDHPGRGRGPAGDDARRPSGRARRPPAARGRGRPAAAGGAPRRGLTRPPPGRAGGPDSDLAFAYRVARGPAPATRSTFTGASGWGGSGRPASSSQRSRG